MAAVKEDYVRKGEIIRVIDGDTVEVRVELGCDIGITMKARMAGINAPEVRSPAGKQSKAWLSHHLQPGLPVMIKTTKGDEKEKYGRYLVTVFDAAGKINYNEVSVADGFSVPYK